MPLKQGPHGTFRRYSSANGRYVKMSAEELLSLFTKKEKVYTKKQKQEIRTEALRKQAMKSPEPFLYEVFDFLEKHIPHYVKFVNERTYNPSENKTRELDIIGKNAIIEVKGGYHLGYINQLTKQKEIADRCNKKVILFAPHITYNATQEYLKIGIKVTKDLESLIKEVKNEND